MQQNFSRRSLIFGAMSLTLPTWVMAAPTKNFAQRADVQKWARQIARQEKLPYRWVIENLGKAKHIATSVRIMDQPRLTAGNQPDDWFAHRKNFMNAVRMNEGLAFIKKNRPTILAVQKQFNIPGAVLVAIIGIETVFGLRQGDYRTLDTLTTLSFDHKRRAEFFRKELVSYLKVCRATKTDPTKMKGSFAGAVGMCQFIPSNIGAYGVDFDKNGSIDLNNSVADALASVANYLTKHNWQSRLAIAWECEATPRIYQRLKAGGGRTHTTLARAIKAGVKMKEHPAASPATPVMLVRLKSPKGDTWRLGTDNFEAIMRYNRSYFYAETVRELAMALIEADPALAGPMILSKDTPHQVIEGESVTQQTPAESQNKAQVKEITKTQPQKPVQAAQKKPTASRIRETIEPEDIDVSTPAKVSPQKPVQVEVKSQSVQTEGVRIEINEAVSHPNMIRESETIIETKPVKVLPESPALPESPVLPSVQSGAPAPVEPTVYAVPDFSQPLMPDGIPLNAQAKDWAEVLVTPAVDPAIFDK